MRVATIGSVADAASPGPRFPAASILCAVNAQGPHVGAVAQLGWQTFDLHTDRTGGPHYSFVHLAPVHPCCSVTEEVMRKFRQAATELR